MDLDDITPLTKTEVGRFMLRHFIVTGNQVENMRRAPTRFAVVCANIQRAIALAEERYPKIIVMSVADQGAIDKVDKEE